MQEDKKDKNTKKDGKRIVGGAGGDIQEAPIAEMRELKQESSSNPWIISTILFLIISIVLAILLASNYRPEAKVSSEVAAREVALFLKNAFGVDLEFDTIEEKEGFYEISYMFSGRKFLIAATQDLSFIRLPNGNWIRKAELDFEETGNESSQDQITGEEEVMEMEDKGSEEIVKSDKPKVELFVMSLCPYTLQAEKGILPAIEALKGKIDFKVRFMHYLLQGAKEDEENRRQLCFREEQTDRFLPYLTCFLNTGKPNDCIKSIAINTTKLERCIKNTSQQYYLTDSKLSKSYPLEQSPTLIINGQQVEFFPRDSSTALETICSAFKIKPSECTKELSTENPSSQFGAGTDDKNIEGYCE